MNEMTQIALAIAVVIALEAIGYWLLFSGRMLQWWTTLSFRRAVRQVAKPWPDITVTDDRGRKFLFGRRTASIIATKDAVDGQLRYLVEIDLVAKATP